MSLIINLWRACAARVTVENVILFWTPIEVDHAICRLKSNSASGPDSLSPRHLKYSGPLLRKWICNIFNAIISMEHIPSTFKSGIYNHTCLLGQSQGPASTREL